MLVYAVASVEGTDFPAVVVGIALCAAIAWVIVAVLRSAVLVDDAGFVVRFMLTRRVPWTELREVHIRGNGFGSFVKVKTTRWPRSRTLPVGSNGFGRPRKDSPVLRLAGALRAHLPPPSSN